MSNPISPGQRAREVFFGGIDITEYVIDLPTLPLMKSEWGAIPSFQQLSIVVGSANKEFHPTHPVSFLTGIDTYGVSVVVRQFGTTQWSGTLIDYDADLSGYKTTLVAASDLQQQLNTSGRLDSDEVTPSEAIRNLLTLHSIDTDSASFTAANDILNDIPCRVRVNPDLLEWQGTLADLISPLLAAGICRLWQTETGAIGCDSFRIDPNPTLGATITDDDLEKFPDIIDEGFNPLQGYSVKFLYGTTQSSDITEDIKSLDFSGEQIVTATTQATADYTGSQWVALSTRQYLRMELCVSRDLASIIAVGHHVTIDSDSLGFSGFGEVLGVDHSDPKWSRITVRIDKGLQ